MGTLVAAGPVAIGRVIRMAVGVPVTAAVGGPVIRIVVVMAGRALEVPV